MIQLKKISRGYNFLSFFYDGLVLLFGNVAFKSQTSLIPHIRNDLNILIIGEGTGKFLRKLLDLKPGSRVTCLDIAPKMLRSANVKIKGKNSMVRMVCQDAFDFTPPEAYDLIVTNFFFDQYSRESFERIMARYKGCISKDGSWYFTDFVPRGKFFGPFVMFLLYRFFGTICRVEARSLENFPLLFMENGYFPVKTKDFFFNIQAIIFKKENHDPI